MKPDYFIVPLRHNRLTVLSYSNLMGFDYNRLFWRFIRQAGKLLFQLGTAVVCCKCPSICIPHSLVALGFAEKISIMSVSLKMQW